MKFNIGDRVLINGAFDPRIIVDIIGDQHFIPIIKTTYPFSSVRLTLVTPAMKQYSGPLTQEEVDEIVQYYDESGYGQINMDLEMDEYDELVPDVIPKSCSHVWKKYVGITYTDHYCSVCNAKKESV